MLVFCEVNYKLGLFQLLTHPKLKLHLLEDCRKWVSLPTLHSLTHEVLQLTEDFKNTCQMIFEKHHFIIVYRPEDSPTASPETEKKTTLRQIWITFWYFLRQILNIGIFFLEDMLLVKERVHFMRKDDIWFTNHKSIWSGQGGGCLRHSVC